MRERFARTLAEVHAMSVAGVSSEREKARPAAPAARARSRRVRALRSFVAVLSGVAAFAAFQLGLAAVVEIRMPEIRDPFYGRRLHLVQKRLHAEPSKPWTVMMLGSSRTEWAFRVGKGEEKAWAEILGHPVATFNLGVPGAGSLTELLTWGRLRRDGVRPKLLLIEVLPAYLAAPPSDYGEVFLPTDRLAWRDLPLIERYVGNIRTGLRRDWLASWPMAGYTHRLSLISLVGPDLLPPEYRPVGNEALDESGAPRFLGAPVTSEQRLRATQRAGDDYHGRFAGFQLGGPQCQALRELLASCRKEGVSVALVVMPEGPTFRSWYPPGSWEAVQEWLTQVSREYHAPLVNAREWIDDENDFMDSHHLLRSGRDKFMERLARECIVPLLRRTQDKEPYAARLP
jgi:hypothetical protein